MGEVHIADRPFILSLIEAAGCRKEHAVGTQGIYILEQIISPISYVSRRPIIWLLWTLTSSSVK